MQGREQQFAELKSSAFYDEVLSELNDLSHVLERLYTTEDIAVMRQEVEGLLGRHKPTGNAPAPGDCPRCGKRYPYKA
jgi:hypothetical protein